MSQISGTYGQTPVVGMSAQITSETENMVSGNTSDHGTMIEVWMLIGRFDPRIGIVGSDVRIVTKIRTHSLLAVLLRIEERLPIARMLLLVYSLWIRILR